MCEREREGEIEIDERRNKYKVYVCVRVCKLVGGI